MGIVVIGAIFVDIKGFPESKYDPVGRNAGHIEYVHGGVVRNIAHDIANLGLNPTLVSLVDNTGLGQEVIDLLENHGVDVQYIHKIPSGMGSWLAVFDESGNLAGSISQRPDLSSIYDLLNHQGDDIFNSCDAIVLEADIDENIVLKTLEYAKKYNKLLIGVISNMSIAVERKDYIKQFDCLICNDIEAGIFLDNEYTSKDPQDILDDVCLKIKEINMNSMVVTLGSKGAIYASYNESGMIPANKVEVKDTTGAGDAFAAGLTVGLTYTHSLKKAVTIGTALASDVIEKTTNVSDKYKLSDFIEKEA